MYSFLQQATFVISLSEILQIPSGSKNLASSLGILSIPGRTYKFLKSKRFKTPIVKGISKQGIVN